MLRNILNQLPLATPYLIVTTIGIGLFWPTWFRLFNEWLRWEQVLAHGLPTFLIFVSLLIIHPPRPPRLSLRTAYSVAGSVVLIAIVGIWALLELIRIDTLTFLMLPAGLLALAWALMGAHSALRFLPYVLLLCLSLPIWSDLVPLLVQIATAVVTRAVSALGITALIEGANITLPYGRLVIADGCSGIRYFAISILLAAIIAILNDFRWKSWVMAVATAMLVALIVNWVRITALVVIAYQTNMESSLVKDHEMFGWLIYAAFIIPIMLLAPVHRRTESTSLQPPGFAPKGFAVVFIALLVGPVGISLAHSRASDQAIWNVSVLRGFPAAPGAFPAPLSLPRTLDHQAWRVAEDGWVSVAQEVKLDRDEKLVPYLPPRVDRTQWFLSDYDASTEIRIYKNLLTHQQVAVLERFHVGSYETDHYLNAKLLQIPATLAGENRFALVTAQSACGPRNCQIAKQKVRHLMNQVSLESDR